MRCHFTYVWSLTLISSTFLFVHGQANANESVPIAPAAPGAPALGPGAPSLAPMGPGVQAGAPGVAGVGPGVTVAGPAATAIAPEAVVAIDPLLALKQNIAQIMPRFHQGPARLSDGRIQCPHVLELLLRTLHGHHDFRPANFLGAGSTLIRLGPGGVPIASAAPEIGDLELLSVCLVAEGTDISAPVFAVTLCNKSPINLHNVRISIVALLGQIDPTSPTTTITIAELCAGQTATIQMQLPETAMAMGLVGRQVVQFDTVVVVIDSFDEFFESCEWNNIAILSRAAIAPVAVAVEVPAAVGQPVESAPVGAAPIVGAPNGPASQAPAPNIAIPSAPGAGPGVVPNGPTSPSPIDQIDLDSLDLRGADGTSLRLND